MNEYIKLEIDFHSLFDCKLNETSSVQHYKPSFGSTIEVILCQTRNKRKIF